MSHPIQASPVPASTAPALWIIKTGAAPAPLRAAHGDFEDWIAQGLRAGPGGSALQIRTLDARALPEWPAQDEIAGVVVTGSPAMVTDREAWSERTAQWLVRLMQGATPLLGICYGHQLLAHALGGEVAHHPAGLEIGSVAVQCLPAAAGDPLLGGLPREFAAHTVHEQSVRRLPAGAVPLAANAHEAHHAFRAGPCAWGVQFHPEFSQTVMQDYVRLFAPSLHRGGVDVQALHAAVAATPAANGLLARFASLTQGSGSGSGSGSASQSQAG
ncbi:glutamine amidotransferase [Acidovorax sp. Leaf78]|uniref:glutamine amidotransferase n=1 Tax=unclassified Acidovorax TaxID=2684926 RepID=UPI0006FEC224|nr:glutamine amidotransferase [Acidovorax sp. Leaf78]KQO23392.1 hypothetical protein ASF16_04270 [Acidovorax sp. Leaf78]